MIRFLGSTTRTWQSPPKCLARTDWSRPRQMPAYVLAYARVGMCLLVHVKDATQASIANVMDQQGHLQAALDKYGGAAKGPRSRYHYALVPAQGRLTKKLLTDSNNYMLGVNHASPLRCQARCVVVWLQRRVRLYGKCTRRSQSRKSPCI